MPNDPKPATEEQTPEDARAKSGNGFVTTEQLMEEQGITGPPDFDSWPVLPWFPEVDD